MSRYLKCALRCLFVFALFIGLSQYHSNAQEDKSLAHLNVLAQVISLVKKYYVKPVSLTQLIQGSIKGVVQSLDPHSEWLSKSMYQKLSSHTQSEFGGIGINIAIRNKKLIVVAPLEDSPAAKAGILAGDEIISIGGVSVDGWRMSQVSEKMQGPKGKSITLGVVRAGLDHNLQITITRQIIKAKTVKHVSLGEGIEYVRITGFRSKTGSELKSLMLNRLAPQDVKGMVLDLRQNPGGLFDQAVVVSDFFLKKGVIVSTRGRRVEDREVVQAKDDRFESNYPMVVLIDEHSASASEIVAGALKDNKRAVVMGRTSFGKGSVQSVVELPDGSALKLTVAHYYTPSGQSIQGKGVKPDLLLEKILAENQEKNTPSHASDTKDTIRLSQKNKKLLQNTTPNASVKPHKEQAGPREELLRNFDIKRAYNHLKLISKIQSPSTTQPSASTL